jgi:catechol 2,3-dioxygenase-like lactoylglutathione lyase family enzyme
MASDAARINHFSFTVADLERSVDFYASLFGFARPEILEVSGRWISTMTGFPETRLRIAFMELVPSVLELIEYVSPAGINHVRRRTCDVGSAHVALDVLDIDAIAPALEAAGGTFVSHPVLVTSGAWQGRRIVYATDPDGIVVELVEPLPEDAVG